MSSINASDAPVLGFLAIFLLIAVVRMYRMTRGTSASPTRLLTVAGLYLFIFAISAAGDALVLPIWLVPVEIALLVVGAIVTAVYVRRVVDLSPHPRWGWSYRLGFALPAIYLLLFAVRIGADFAILNGATFFGSTGSPAPAVSGVDLYVLEAVDALFSVSAGLIVGRSVGVYLALQDRQKASPPPPAPPGSPPPLPSGNAP